MTLVLINHEITSAHQVSQLTRPLGYDIVCQQLEVGPMQGYLRTVLCGNQVFLENRLTWQTGTVVETAAQKKDQDVK